MRNGQVWNASGGRKRNPCIAPRPVLAAELSPEYKGRCVRSLNGPLLTPLLVSTCSSANIRRLVLKNDVRIRVTARAFMSSVSQVITMLALSAQPSLPHTNEAWRMLRAAARRLEDGTRGRDHMISSTCDAKTVQCQPRRTHADAMQKMFGLAWSVSSKRSLASFAPVKQDHQTFPNTSHQYKAYSITLLQNITQNRIDTRVFNFNGMGSLNSFILGHHLLQSCRHRCRRCHRLPRWSSTLRRA